METADPGPVPEHTPAETRLSTDELLEEAFRCTVDGLPIAAAGYYTELDRRLRAGERPPVAWVSAS